jgi:hypothetical protein
MLNGHDRNPSRPILAPRYKQDPPLAFRKSPPSRQGSRSLILRSMRWPTAFCSMAMCALFATQAYAQEKQTLSDRV